MDSFISFNGSCISNTAIDPAMDKSLDLPFILPRIMLGNLSTDTYVLVYDCVASRKYKTATYASLSSMDGSIAIISIISMLSVSIIKLRVVKSNFI